jgi:glycosyltransferase involved in cell wall biosynthesis
MGRAVAVLVTCYDQGRFVEACLDGILAQTFTDWELVVVDDVSHDDAPERVQAWLDAHPEVDGRLLVNPTNIGVTGCLNRGLAETTAPFVAYCGGDDVWDPDKLARQVAALEADPAVALVYADARYVDPDGEPLGGTVLERHGRQVPPVGDLFAELLRENFIQTATVLYRRTALEAIGGWDADLHFEDWDVFLRLADRHPFTAIDDVLVSYRVHPDSMSQRRVAPMLESRLRLLAKWVGRDDATDAVIHPYLQEQSWRLFKVHPALAREHVAVAYAQRTGVVGRLRRWVATSATGERLFEVARRVTRPLRRT